MYFSSPSTLLLAALAPAVLFASPVPEAAESSPEGTPRITSISWSGNGCADPGSAKTSATSLDGTLSASFTQFKSDSSSNCQLHAQASGAGAGWQVAVKEATYHADVALKPSSSLTFFTTSFWSQDAGNTNTLKSRIDCTGSDIKDSVTVKQSTNSPVWSQCTGDSGYPGILNVNFRPSVTGDEGTYNVKSASIKFEWRRC